MIGRLRGILLVKQAPHLLVDVHGVGYELEAPLSTFYELPPPGTEVVLYTHVVVREDAHWLYGFFSEQERGLFRYLIKVNGVGPKLALTILSGISAPAFAQCVRAKDADTLTRLPGIGKKTAQRLVMELQDHLQRWDLESTNPAHAVPSTSSLTPIDEAVAALASLGYKPAEALSMTRAINCDGLSSEQIIRRALQALLKS